VGYVTNGVHVPTWDSFRVDNEWERLFGPERWRRNLNEMAPSEVQHLDDKRLWKMAAQSRALLVDYARKRLEQQWRREADPEQCHLFTERPLDPNLLTLGFARRFAAVGPGTPGGASQPRATPHTDTGGGQITPRR